ncbi:unnamed protein product [Rotaria magnacalcarata]|uniref:Domain of unknown function with conserved HDNR motif domain-containing protein n=1 Tax=Rotaria magnacalcarata TaxID=392030 RepID=A0A816U4H8_9BILA|nr:unnamed protein product [Rotaria magnacalcarata]CAF1312500.1 unnamed protein product [Rotaria magnacalcarata]CAF2109396.1 unnamed protein product [Rotaria magnacalcarata]CAF3807530.1 unnamed protein product [Rotaria magnacalcarata]CAF3864466.1 unnamed protein product [Rotaria magnacalcarata]
MSQVQIRQISAKSFSNNQQVMGSWFPTGYYGHFRAKSRIDICNDFRQLARPDPPRKFLERQNSEASTHKFSQHDNKFKFECDPLVRSTQPGFGRRKLKTNAQGKFDPMFIGWIPKNVDRNQYIENTKTTSYAHDYNPNSTSTQFFSNLESIHSPSSTNELSVYSTVFNHGQPDREQSKQTRQETFQRFSSALTRRFDIKRNDRSTSVASCLIWNTGNDENKLTTTNNEPTISTNPSNSNIQENDSSMVNQQKPYQCQSMQTFKAGVMTSRDNRNNQVKSSCQRSTSLKETRTNSMDNLITKYM